MKRQFTELEIQNQKFLIHLHARFEIVCLSSNILKHAMFDAKKNIRSFLKEYGIHDFYTQPFGQNAKCMIRTHVLTFKRDIWTETSLYRSGTRGDCRMWFGSVILPITDVDDLYVITAVDKELYIVNISKVNLESSCKSSFPNPIQTWLKAVRGNLKG